MEQPRFGRYLDALREAAALRDEFRLDPVSDESRWRLFTEALVQCRPLILSRPIWDALDREGLQDRLKTIRGGSLLPAPGVQHDHARNTLLELDTLAALAELGFETQLMRGGPDVIAAYPGLDPYAVECKRPTSVSSLRKHIKAAREQIRGRGSIGLKRGICAIGIDRVVGLSGKKLIDVKTAAEFDMRIQRYLRELGDQLELIMAEGPLFTKVPIVVFVLSVAVFAFEDRRLVVKRVFAAVVTVPDDDPRGGAASPDLRSSQLQAPVLRDLLASSTRT